jgi:hypothetical protein
MAGVDCNTGVFLHGTHKCPERWMTLLAQVSAAKERGAKPGTRLLALDAKNDAVEARTTAEARAKARTRA